MIFLVPIFVILFWIAALVVGAVLLGIIWSVLGLLVGLESVTHWLTGRKNAASSKRNLPRGPSSRNSPPKGLSRPKPPLKTPGSSRRNIQPAPKRPAAETRVTSDIWPKWTPSRRREVDRELALWQEQFDALSSPK